MSLWTILREAANERPHDEPRAIATDVLESLDRDNLITLLADEIAGQQRMRVHAVERRGFSTLFVSSGSAPEGFVPSPDPFAALRGERVALGNGVKIEWHHLTTDQHMERIAMLDRMRAGLGDTIERHQLAIRLIRDAGVTCLADLDKPKARKRAARHEPARVAEAAD